MDILDYIRVDFENKDFKKILSFMDKEETNFFYISMPPESTEDILLFLIDVKKKGYKIKVLIEKPFGKSLEHAKKLAQEINNGNLKEDIFISDHYLFKKEILELKNIDFKKLKFVSIEKIGIEGRIGYYNDVGALKDMIQSHFMNVLFRLHKIKDKTSIKLIEKHWGEYGNGSEDGYIKELGKKSDTETYVDIKFIIDDREIEFTTGKKFNKKETYLEIDGKKIIIEDENPYGTLFSKFFKNKKEFFPTIEDSILSWEIISKIKKDRLFFYKEGISLEEIKIIQNL
jgi:glucose-6-phosphate 1-dehydrogenase